MWQLTQKSNMELNPQSFHIDYLLMFGIIWWKYLFFSVKDVYITVMNPVL